MSRERRILTGVPEVRQIGDQRSFAGRAVTYNSMSELLFGSFREVIAPGTFDECLRENPDIIACVDHKPEWLLGRTRSGTLKLTPGPDGIDMDVSDPDTSYSRDLRQSISRGDIRGMSFVFDVTDDDWSRSGGTPLRTVTRAKIHEVSFVVFPAYTDTDASARSLDKAREIDQAWLLAGHERRRHLLALMSESEQRSRYRVGQKVDHIDYGIGTVTAVYDAMGDHEYDVKFGSTVRLCEESDLAAH
jgi:HK97 family phage prohead protease